MTPSKETIAAVRFGYGFRPGQPPERPEDLLDGVLRGARRDAEAEPTIAARMTDYSRLASLRRSHGPDGPGPELRDARRQFRRQASEDAGSRVRRTVAARESFHERLVWFWADHFTVAARNQRGRAIAPAFENEAIRPHVAGRFADLLRAAVRHPVMLVYLDQERSVGPRSPIGTARGLGLNENLAREILELHTLGADADYRQRDVRQFAELLTGLSIDRRAGETAFRPNWAEPGAETVLGRRYGGGRPKEAAIDAALEDLAMHPATARHIARKLATHFVSDTPEAALVVDLADAYVAADGELMALYAALLGRPASWENFGAKVRQPFDYVVASLRAAGAAKLNPADGVGAPDPAEALRRINQPLWGAPGPDGWPEAAEAWITPPGLTARIDWASRLGAALAPHVDPRDFVDDALRELARPETRFATRAAAERWEGIALVLASPEFNRR